MVALLLGLGVQPLVVVGQEPVGLGQVRLVAQGGVSLGGEKVKSADAEVPVTGEPVLQVGKRRFARVVAP